MSTISPGSRRTAKDQITVEQLLLHTSGLIADNPLSDYDDGPEKAFERINNLKPRTEPGTKFTYSDVNYIVLGKIVEQLSGEPLDVFSRKNIFEPLGLHETTFKPGEAYGPGRADRTARRSLDAGRGPRPALVQAGRRGRARRTVFDGRRSGRFCPDAARQRRLSGRAHSEPGDREADDDAAAASRADCAALGWDVQTAYSGNRGELFSPAALATPASREHRSGSIPPAGWR